MLDRRGSRQVSRRVSGLVLRLGHAGLVELQLLLDLLVQQSLSEPLPFSGNLRIKLDERRIVVMGGVGLQLNSNMPGAHIGIIPSNLFCR